MYWPKYSLNSDGWVGKYELARARDKFPKASLFGDKNNIYPTDMKQGNIDDCYFTASCSGIAQYDARVRKIFETSTYTKSGMIAIKGMVLGKEYTIVVDDILPFYKNRATPELMFNGLSDSNSLWGPFLEKAWAKVHGSYNQISGGTAAEVF